MFQDVRRLRLEVERLGRGELHAGGQLVAPDSGIEPLVALAAFANAGLGLPWIVGRALGLGNGIVTAVTYEYGNTFLIVAGLLNALILLDAFDIAMGRK